MGGRDTHVRVQRGVRSEKLLEAAGLEKVLDQSAEVQGQRMGGGGEQCQPRLGGTPLCPVTLDCVLFYLMVKYT